jgi:Flp pilus assembly protein TadG
VEFAMILPIVALLAFALIDYGQVVNLQTELNSAARQGAQYALAHPDDANGIVWAVKNATKTPAADVTATAKTTTPSGSNTYYCTCGTSDPTLANQVDCNSGLCTSPAVKKFFITVTASQTYTPILPYPGVPSSFALRGAAAVQMQ